jgi:outer membrane lipoprotein SlyB
MKAPRTLVAATVAAVALLSGCASSPSYTNGGYSSGYGGGYNGSGSGRTAATVAGGVGGAVVGNNIERNRNAGGGQEMYQVNVRMDNGEYRTVVQDSAYDLRVGNRVRLVDGRVYRY